MEVIAFQISCMFFSVLLITIYFSKKRIKNLENKIFEKIIVVNFIALILDLSAFYIVKYIPLSIYANIVCRLILIGLSAWISLFTLYMCAISMKDLSKYNLYKRILITVFALSIVIVSLLPLTIVGNDNHYYSTGDAVKFLYIYSVICVLFWIIMMLKNIKKIISKKYYPIFAYMLIGIIVIVVQYIYPWLILMVPMETFITYLMYFTIENPDVKMIEQLNIARTQAEKANQAKTEFLSSMSHEIRTPLNAIVGFSQVLKEEDIPDSIKDEINDITVASDNLLEIVNGILDISKIEANKLEIINTEYSFKKIFDDLVTLTKARIGNRDLDFRIKYDESIPTTLYGDHTRIKQIILNLLTNAVKYTKTGFVEFKVNSVIKDDMCRIIVSVEDSGIGIKEKSIDKLFSKFERLDVEKSITIEGTGLGLAITKRLVDLMSGKIVVQSVYGEGSKFTVALDQKIIKRLVEEEPVVIEDKSEVDFSGKRILVVDDNLINLKVASRLLQIYKVEVVTANSGFECVDRIKNNEHYDLIFLDDMMPKMSGSETLEKLKELPSFNTKTIALTANAIAGMREKYLGLGFDNYLSKPINRKELDDIIKEYLSN